MGVKIRPKKVTPSMPLKTVTPSGTRISAPAPLATARGTTPRIKAKAVMRIGRKRVRDASTMASTRLMPESSSCLANSTTRIAFLAARPIKTTNPIWAKMLLSSPTSHKPKSAERMHMGTISKIASGRDQFSY